MLETCVIKCVIKLRMVVLRKDMCNGGCLFLYRSEDVTVCDCMFVCALYLQGLTYDIAMWLISR